MKGLRVSFSSLQILALIGKEYVQDLLCPDGYHLRKKIA